MNNKFLPISFLIVIGSSFIIEKFYPGLPGYFYLVYAIIAGVLLLIINNRRIKKKKLIVTDERIVKNAEKAAHITYRYTYSILLVVGTILTVVPTETDIVRIIGIVLIFASIFETLIFTISYFLINRNN